MPASSMQGIGVSTDGHIGEGMRAVESRGMVRGSDRDGKVIWTCAPAASETVLEQFAKQGIVGLGMDFCLFFPSIRTSLWRKCLMKLFDVAFKLPVGSVWWPVSMYEPLTLAFIPPLANRRPFQFKNTVKYQDWRKSARHATDRSRLGCGSK